MTRADFFGSIRRAVPGLLAATIIMTGPTLAQQAGVNFPAGAGKDDVVAVCGGCHDINRLKAGYTADGWRTVMRMMQNFGAPPAPDHATTVTDYLIKNFPEGPRPAAAVIELPADIAIKECRLRRRVHGRTIRLPRATDRYGTPASSPTCWGGLIQGPGKSRNIPSTRKPDRMA